MGRGSRDCWYQAEQAQEQKADGKHDSFERFPAVVAQGNLIERWHVSDFHVSRARNEPEAGYGEHLSREGENLALVIEYLHDNHPQVFSTIKAALQRRVPGITQVESRQTEEGRVLLKFQDGAFADPFLARHVSDGTIKDAGLSDLAP